MVDFLVDLGSIFVRFVVGWLVGWLLACLIELIGWLVGWLVVWSHTYIHMDLKIRESHGIVLISKKRAFSWPSPGCLLGATPDISIYLYIATAAAAVAPNIIC